MIIPDVYYFYIKKAWRYQQLIRDNVPQEFLKSFVTPGCLSVKLLSLISRPDKVELIATEFFQQSCDCLGYLEQHTKSCKSYLVGKYNYFLLKDDHFYA